MDILSLMAKPPAIDARLDAENLRFILGLKRLNHPATARSGNRLSSVGMLIAIVVTLFDQAIIGYGVIVAGLLVGTAIGLWAARSVKIETSMSGRTLAASTFAQLGEVGVKRLFLAVASNTDR